MKTIKVALVGNPNVGKTSILNYLVGSSLKIGNWSGVTVEKKEGTTYFQDYKIHFIDLPGIYTLENVVSEDEKIALDFLLKEDYDVILNVIETPKIERDLYLTCQLLDIGKPLVIALNMIDEAKSLGIEVDAERLEQLLKTKVVKTIGRTGEGVKDILPAIVKVCEKKTKPVNIVYPKEIEEYIAQKQRSSDFSLPKFVAIEELKKEQPQVYELVKQKRFRFSQGIAKEITRKKLLPKEHLTEVLDRIFLHPWIGNICFLLIMYLFFKISFDFSSPFIDWIDGFMQEFLAPLMYQLLASLGTPEFLKNFISSAVIGGVGMVLTFLPLIFTMYFLLTLLETSGYLPRVAFLMDRFTHKIGLHGQSIIPLILGLGCNVPAILATRTFQESKDKFLVMAMIPFISCPARLVIFAYITFIFFKNPVFVIFLLYLGGLILSIFTSILLRKTLLKKELSHFVMDLPPYRVPSLKTVLNITKIYLKEFIYRAGTIIFLVSLVIWLLLNLPTGEKNIANSYAGKIGRALSYIFEPIGLGDWRITTSLLSGMLAREAIISNMGVILSEEKESPPERIEPLPALKEQVKSLAIAFKEALISLLDPLPRSLKVEEEGSGLRAQIAKLFTLKQAISLLLFVLIYNSCVATIVAMGEEGNWRFALGFLLYSFILAWLAGFISYHFF
jgi:ferrous iron transport protein B